MRIIAKVEDYSKGTNQELANKLLANIEGYFKKSFPNGTFTGSLGNELGADYIEFHWVLADPKISLHNDPLYHSFIIQWGDGFGSQPLTLEEGAELEMSILKSGISVEPPKGSYLAKGTVKTGIRAIKSKGTLAMIDKKFKDFIPKLRKLFDKEVAKGTIYKQDEIDPKYLK